ncbi:MAG TPA: response regulator [Acidobacteriaceae bacterium]|nr:response regulator [Acidobacteriaceae bacterium]
MQARNELRVFVVDDEDVIASTLAMILRLQGGFHATSFTDPLKALAAARVEAPDLLISDVVMPEPSVITLKPAIRYQFKTGQRDWPKT